MDDRTSVLVLYVHTLCSAEYMEAVVHLFVVRVNDRIHKVIRGRSFYWYEPIVLKVLFIM